MSLRFPSLAALFASALFVSQAQADRLLVAGSDGFVFQADTEVGTFEYFACQCGGPIVSMAADSESLYAGDALGQLLVFDVDDGGLTNIHPLPFGPLKALATAEGDVFAGTQDGFVLRIEPATGEILEARVVPGPVSALTAHRGHLFAAVSGGIYRAPVAGGDFTYFTCFCFFDLRSLTVVDSTLVAADANGTVAHISLVTGEVINAFWIGSLNSMVAESGDLLLHLGNGAIARHSLADGQPMPGGYTSPIAVDAMLVIRGEAGSQAYRAAIPPK